MFSSWSTLKISLTVFMKTKKDSLAKLQPEARESSSVSEANERVVAVMKTSRKRKEEPSQDGNSKVHMPVILETGPL